MDSLFTLIREYKGTDIIIIIALVWASAKWIFKEIAGVKAYIKKYLEDNYTTRKSVDDKEEDTDTRLDNVEQDSAKMQQYLAELHEMLENLCIAMKENNEQNRRTTIATSRSTIYRVCAEALERKYMTQIEFEILDELGDIYISLGGNHTAKDRLLPNTLALPVQGADGLMYKATPQNVELNKLIKENNYDGED